MRVLLVANPRAAHCRARAAVEGQLALFARAGVDLELVWTRAPADATAMVRDGDLGGFDAVVAARGDRPVLEVVNGHLAPPAGERPPLAVLPVGTGNSFCRDLELGPRPVAEAVRRIAAGRSRRVDVGRFCWAGGDTFFVNILGLGFVSDVSVTAHRLKWLGSLSYSVAVVLETIRLAAAPLTLEVDGVRHDREGVFLEVANTRYTGGSYLMAPAARFDDGLLDVVLATTMGRVRLLSAFPKIFSGAHVTLPEVETWQAKEIVVTTPESKLLAPDGEILGTTPVAITCLPGALAVLG